MNILLITSDQQHFSTLGCVNPTILTPNLDRLAAGGTRYERAYCNNPLCSPSRSTIITGQYPAWHGCWTIGVKLGEDVPTVGQYLGAAGYRTSLVGKAHFQPLATRPDQTSIECQPILRNLDLWRVPYGPWYGFDEVEMTRNHADEPHVGQHYACWMEQNGLTNWRDYFQEYPVSESTKSKYPPGTPYWLMGRQHSWDLPAEYHYTTWTAERSIAQIEKSVAQNRPFFHWASFHDPHPPYLVPEPWASMYRPEDITPGAVHPGEMDLLPPHIALTQQPNPDYSPWQETPYGNHGFHSHLIDPAAHRRNLAVYYGMISFMDQQIGRILDHLEKTRILDDTLVIFTTDHGHYLGQHGLIAKGAFHFEDLVRVPFIVRHPNQQQRGDVSRGIQSLVDLAPSFLCAAGVPIPGQMQGLDQTSVWKRDAESVRSEAIVENRHQPSAVHVRTYVTDRYKLTIYRDHEYGELFDLETDPHEVQNRWGDPAFRDIKSMLYQQILNAEIRREPTRYERIADA